MNCLYNFTVEDFKNRTQVKCLIFEIKFALVIVVDPAKNVNTKKVMYYSYLALFLIEIESPTKSNFNMKKFNLILLFLIGYIKFY